VTRHCVQLARASLPTAQVSPADGNNCTAVEESNYIRRLCAECLNERACLRWIGQMIDAFGRVCVWETRQLTSIEYTDWVECTCSSLSTTMDACLTPELMPFASPFK